MVMGRDRQKRRLRQKMQKRKPNKIEKVMVDIEGVLNVRNMYYTRRTHKRNMQKQTKKAEEGRI